jgi:hypothetical protein
LKSNVFKLGLVTLALAAVSACQQVPLPKNIKAGSVDNKSTKPTRAKDIYGPPTKLADLEDRTIAESSGLVASRTTPGSYWTHNDSGNGPLIYAFDSNGHRRGVWRVTGATAEDWEDIAAGPGPKPNQNYLYIGDIGDNSDNRSEIIVYRIPEPVIPGSDPGSTTSKPQATEPAEAVRLRYPDGKHDAEALLVHPKTGKIYVVLKVPFANPGVYAAEPPRDSSEPTTLTHLGELDIPGVLGGIITGGAISPDGLRVALCDYLQGYELVLADADAPFDTVWKQPIRSVDLGKRKHGESISYRLDGKALMATSERLPTPLIELVRR